MPVSRRKFMQQAAVAAAAVPGAPLLRIGEFVTSAASGELVTVGSVELEDMQIFQPHPEITFCPGNQTIGRLWWSDGGRFEFDGDASASARCFLESITDWLTPTLERAGWTPPAGKETPPADVDIYPWPGI